MNRVLLPIVTAIALCGCDLSPGGTPTGADTEMRGELAPFYEWLFAQVEQQTGHDLRVNHYPEDSEPYIQTKLAKDRLVDAANRLVDRHYENRQPYYKIELPYLILTTDKPTHFRIQIDSQLLTGLGVECSGKIPCNSSQ